MIELELLDADRPLVIITRNGYEDLGAWSRLGENLMRGIVGGGPDRIEVCSDVLLAELPVLREVRQIFTTKLKLGKKLQHRLRAMVAERRNREAALSSLPADSTQIEAELTAAGFKRTLKSFQLDNLCRIASLPHGADFSVPGAGKTTVALANFALQRHRNIVQRMLVVAPLAAFAAWKEDVMPCFNDPPKIEAHLGANRPLPTTADILLTNYHRLASDYDRLRQWAQRAPTQVTLDEAHRVKKGRSAVHGRTVLDFAFVAARRDVLTGTPAPQGAHDLVSMIQFLYPGQAKQILPQNAFIERLGREPKVLEQTHEAVRRYFVRTRKSDLGLPPVEMKVVSQVMEPLQKAIYESLLGKYRDLFQLGDPSRPQLRRLGRIMMYLLEAATNPMLLTAGSDPYDLASFKHGPLELTGEERVTTLLSLYGDYEKPWKYQKVWDIVEEAAQTNQKVLIWTTFVRNIRCLKNLLAPWNPAVVHGGIPPQDGASPNAATTREAELERFRTDDNCNVLLANPAACGEGVSLHHWCHHAVYLDRTFNAGHFLQSQDRIHRLGLAEGTETKFTFLVSEDTIDATVDQRLRAKVKALSLLMDDPGLVQVALPNDELPEEEDGSLGEEVVDQNDADFMITHLGGKHP